MSCCLLHSLDLGWEQCSFVKLLDLLKDELTSTVFTKVDREGVWCSGSQGRRVKWHLPVLNHWNDPQALGFHWVSLLSIQQAGVEEQKIKSGSDTSAIPQKPQRPRVSVLASIPTEQLRQMSSPGWEFQLGVLTADVLYRGINNS